MKSNALKEPAPTAVDIPDAKVLMPSNEIDMIGHVQVSLEARIGTVTMTIDRLFGLKAGEVVEMNEVLDAPMTLLLNGRPVAHGELLAVDDHFGVRILEVS
jgi:flagellar motor switch protein FliN